MSEVSTVSAGLVFVITLLLMLTRPRGLNEAWAAVGGGLAMLLLGVVTPAQAWRSISQGSDVLAFLFSLMLLSALLDASGFFEWAAVRAALVSRGNTAALYRNVFVLGALITAVLSLDTTAIILTPIVLTIVRRLDLPARPFLFACAFVANTGSLLAPVSNLTNLLFQSRFHLTFGHFTSTMLLPQLLALCANYAVFRWMFAKDLLKTFDRDVLPSADSVVLDRPFFLAACVTLTAVLVGYFVGTALHVAPYVVALGGAMLLLAVGSVRRRVDARRIGGDIVWSLFPFVAGMFVVVQGIENAGAGHGASRLLIATSRDPLVQIVNAAFATAIGSNIVNNIPMALASLSALTHAHAGLAAIYGALLGCNLGPNLTIIGSLATMLVLSRARQGGEDVRGLDFCKVGLIATPLVLLAACAGLWLALQF